MRSRTVCTDKARYNPGDSATVTVEIKNNTGATWNGTLFLDIRHLETLTHSATPEETVRRLASVLRRPDSMRRVLRVAMAEPPRVRAMVGALCEHLGAAEPDLKRLRATLNPTSRYRFGPLATLPTARRWGAR